MHIKDLDLFPRKVYFLLIFKQSSLPVNFQHNPNLLDQGIKPSRRKGFKGKPPRDFGPFLEAFSKINLTSEGRNS